MWQVPISQCHVHSPLSFSFFHKFCFMIKKRQSLNKLINKSYSYPQIILNHFFPLFNNALGYFYLNAIQWKSWGALKVFPRYAENMLKVIKNINNNVLIKNFLIFLPERRFLLQSSLFCWPYSHWHCQWGMYVKKYIAGTTSRTQKTWKIY